MPIIAINGLIGSGKDTVARYLEEKYQYTHLSFAKNLKDIISILFGWDRNKVEGVTPEDREWREKLDEFWTSRLRRPWSPRIALQTLGTDLFRDSLHEDFWIHTLEHKIVSAGDKPKIVISDCRFPNEMTMIKNMGGFLWTITRGPESEWLPVAKRTIAGKPEENGKFMAGMYPNVHYSEWAWVGTNFDLIIRNDGTLQELYNIIDMNMEKYLE